MFYGFYGLYGFYDFYGFYDLLFTAHRLPFTIYDFYDFYGFNDQKINIYDRIPLPKKGQM
jgi:hypothetical protein